MSCVLAQGRNSRNVDFFMRRHWACAFDEIWHRAKIQSSKPSQLYHGHALQSAATRMIATNVGFWHLADILPTMSMSVSGGKADIPDPLSNVR